MGICHKFIGYSYPNNFQRILFFDHASQNVHATWNSLKTLSFPWSDACRPDPWVDAFMSGRALSEHSELARLPVFCVQPI